VNRQTKRLMKRQGGEAPAPAERRRPAPAPPHRERTTAKQFVREVRGELKKVAWPTRPEVVNSTIIVLVAVIVLTTLIFGMDYAFAKGVLFLFD
jgi:preprotein translocase subunit SecE